MKNEEKIIKPKKNRRYVLTHQQKLGKFFQ